MVERPCIHHTATKIYAYGSKKPINLVGSFRTEILSVAHQTAITTEIYVVKGEYGSLLTYQTAVDLDVIPVIRLVTPSKTEQIIDEFSDMFEGIGKIKDLQLQIHVDDSKAHVAQPHRRIPFHMRKKAEAELKRLEQLDIIEKIEGPTPWVSPIVVALKPKKPEEIRICVDMRQVNTAVRREWHITPTIDDIILDLNGSLIFSKLDLNAGYHQVELAPESRNITTCWSQAVQTLNIRYQLRCREVSNHNQRLFGRSRRHPEHQ